MFTLKARCPLSFCHPTGIGFPGSKLLYATEPFSIHFIIDSINILGMLHLSKNFNYILMSCFYKTEVDRGNYTTSIPKGIFYQPTEFRFIINLSRHIKLIYPNRVELFYKQNRKPLFGTVLPPNQKSPANSCLK